MESENIMYLLWFRVSIIWMASNIAWAPELNTVASFGKRQDKVISLQTAAERLSYQQNFFLQKLDAVTNRIFIFWTISENMERVLIVWQEWIEIALQKVRTDTRFCPKMHVEVNFWENHPPWFTRSKTALGNNIQVQIHIVN